MSMRQLRSLARTSQINIYGTWKEQFLNQFLFFFFFVKSSSGERILIMTSSISLFLSFQAIMNAMNLAQQLGSLAFDWKSRQPKTAVDSFSSTSTMSNQQQLNGEAERPSSSSKPTGNSAGLTGIPSSQSRRSKMSRSRKNGLWPSSLMMLATPPSSSWLSISRESARKSESKTCERRRTLKNMRPKNRASPKPRPSLSWRRVSQSLPCRKRKRTVGSWGLCARLISPIDNRSQFPRRRWVLLRLWSRMRTRSQRDRNRFVRMLRPHLDRRWSRPQRDPRRRWPRLKSLMHQRDRSLRRGAFAAFSCQRKIAHLDEDLITLFSLVVVFVFVVIFLPVYPDIFRYPMVTIF